MLKVGIIVYPGSNCDKDTYNYFNDWFDCIYIWHTMSKLEIHIDLLIIPGGFAFGDRVYDKATNNYIIDPGKMAIESEVSNIIFEAVSKKIPILGICNGFQILTKLKLLPGELIINKNNKFNCKKIKVTAYYEDGNYDTMLYIANSYGRYKISEEDYKKLLVRQVFLEYNEKLESVDSYYNIAGISNQNSTIFGMMPHPERNNIDFKPILLKIIFSKNPIIERQIIFYNKIQELMNSEHISYKSTKKFLKKLPTQADWVIQGPGENAGIIDIGDDYCLAVRIESHNHPTFIDPFEGAATGVGGILRDIFTMGARPIAILDFLRFGIDDNSRVLLNSAINGISYYGNCVGVANIGGDCYIGETYNKNPLVNVAAMGIVKKDNIIYGNAKAKGNILIYVGSKTGNEGIGGAAMASKSFKDNSNMDELKNNVQKSDPYLEKLLLESCCEIAENKLAIGMQDMGAGGLLCATYETVLRGREKYNKNLGCKLCLEKVPLKYDMDYCNILISESQERMLIIADQENKIKIFEIFQKWDLECAIIGEITDDSIYSVFFNDEIQFKERIINKKEINEDWVTDDKFVNRIEKKNDSIHEYNSDNEVINVIYKIQDDTLWNRYDFTIGNRTIKGPDQIGTYSIIKLPEVNKNLFVTWQSYNIDIISVNKLFNNFNVKPLCLVNCLNYGHPKEKINELSNFINVLSSFSNEYNIPIVGGNVSLYNSTDNKCITSTPVIVIIGIM